MLVECMMEETERSIKYKKETLSNEVEEVNQGHYLVPWLST